MSLNLNGVFKFLGLLYTVRCICFTQYDKECLSNFILHELTLPQIIFESFYMGEECIFNHIAFDGNFLTWKLFLIDWENFCIISIIRTKNKYDRQSKINLFFAYWVDTLAPANNKKQRIYTDAQWEIIEANNFHTR